MLLSNISISLTRENCQLISFVSDQKPKKTRFFSDIPEAEYNLVNNANFPHLPFLLVDFYSSVNNTLPRSLQLAIVTEVKSFKSFPHENKSLFRFQQFTSNSCHPTCDFQPKSPAGIITIIMLHNAVGDLGYRPRYEKMCRKKCNIVRSISVFYDG